jgi:formate hydrogenlyase subunit 5
MSDPTVTTAYPNALRSAVLPHLEQGHRFCGLYATTQGDATQLLAVFDHGGALVTETVNLPRGAAYTSLAPAVPAAAWYEREIQDLFGLVPAGHPRPDPLVLPRGVSSPPPCPGSGRVMHRVEIDATPLPAHLHGEGVFTIPYGPVRSGVFESIEYLVETPGEDIPHLRTRVHYKHRGIESQFEGMSPDDGVLLAERCEGVASVSHAIAFCTAIETIGDAVVPTGAQLLRVLHAELERIANHLDSTIRHTEAAGQAVAYARLSLHKERVQRLRAELCGNRFGRGVVVPGGVSGPLQLHPREMLQRLNALEPALRSDLHLLMATPSFLDRIRGTGVLSPDTVRRHAALGPVARGSGYLNDARFGRPYAGYPHLGHAPLDVVPEGDALARQRVRLHEIWGSIHLCRQVVDELEQLDGGSHEWRAPLAPASGMAVGWAEAPQGELLYLVWMQGGVLTRVKPRSASFHNLALFPSAFPHDILTDFAFIEASFGLSIAGVAS